MLQLAVNNFVLSLSLSLARILIDEVRCKTSFLAVFIINLIDLSVEFLQYGRRSTGVWGYDFKHFSLSVNMN